MKSRKLLIAAVIVVVFIISIISFLSLLGENHKIDKRVTAFLQGIKKRDGTTVTVKQPHVDTQLCIGCGICETQCSVGGSPVMSFD